MKNKLTEIDFALTDKAVIAVGAIFF